MAIDSDDRTVRDDVLEMLAEFKALRSHLTTTDGNRHSENVSRMDRIEADQKEQTAKLNKILEQTACIPALQKQQDDHEDRIDDLESTRDTLGGVKTALGWVAMLGSGIFGGWINSIFNRHH